jgi:hypothetical protein
LPTPDFSKISIFLPTPKLSKKGSYSSTVLYVSYIEHVVGP